VSAGRGGRGGSIRWAPGPSSTPWPPQHGPARGPAGAGGVSRACGWAILLRGRPGRTGYGEGSRLRGWERGGRWGERGVGCVGGRGRAGDPLGPISQAPLRPRLLLNLIPRPSSCPRHKAGRGVGSHQQRAAGRADPGRRGRAPDPKSARPHRPSGGERPPPLLTPAGRCGQGAEAARDDRARAAGLGCDATRRRVRKAGPGGSGQQQAQGVLEGGRGYVRRRDGRGREYEGSWDGWREGRKDRVEGGREDGGRFIFTTFFSLFVSTDSFASQIGYSINWHTSS
jgi:hypothetical protein